MIAKFFGSITKIGKKLNLQNNFVVKKIIPYYHKMQGFTTSYVVVKPEHKNVLAIAQENDFLIRNTERINAISNILADERSKEAYLGMVKFRQTRLKKDFPFSIYHNKQYFIDE